MTDEDDDRAIPFVNGDRMTLAIIDWNARRHDLVVGQRARRERGRKPDKRAQQAQNRQTIDRCFRCHGFILGPALCQHPGGVSSQSMMKPKLP